MSSPPKFTIEIDVEELDTNVMFFHEKVGDIEYGDQKAALHRTVPGSAFVLHVGDTRYRISAQEICKKLLDKLGQEVEKDATG